MNRERKRMALKLIKEANFSDPANEIYRRILLVMDEFKIPFKEAWTYLENNPDYGVKK